MQTQCGISQFRLGTVSTVRIKRPIARALPSALFPCRIRGLASKSVIFRMRGTREKRVPMRGSRISILPVSALLLVGTEVYGLTGFPFDFKHHRVSRRAPAATFGSASLPIPLSSPLSLTFSLFPSFYRTFPERAGCTSAPIVVSSGM